MRETLDEAASRAEDLFLVYYAGHGIPQDPGDLVLAVSQTARKVPRARGISIGEVCDAFLNSRARTRMLILDCCFSGRALENMGLYKPTATLASVPATSEAEASELLATDVKAVRSTDGCQRSDANLAELREHWFVT